MRTFFLSFFAVVLIVVSVVSFSLIYAQIQSKKEAVRQARFVPVEIGLDGFAQKTFTANEIALINDADSALTIVGNDNADLTVVAFYDYNCPYCMIEEVTLREALEDRNDIRIVIRPVPFTGQDAADVAALAFAAAEENIFESFHQTVIQAKGKMTKGRALTLLKEKGLDDQAFKTRSEAAEIKGFVEQNKQLAIDVGAHYVPAFLIGERLYMPRDRDTKAEEFTKLFNAELAR